MPTARPPSRPQHTAHRHLRLAAGAVAAPLLGLLLAACDPTAPKPPRQPPSPPLAPQPKTDFGAPALNPGVWWITPAPGANGLDAEAAAPGSVPVGRRESPPWV